ncbi:MaoC/PaaZ C-terminal domain-containing protein [Bordetella genomosp. 13]|uniref:MaoC/PaaZ C-terminal domain-containing protein n=1 Tax=Bordetella genomosp. 13 TaxID=463040 RepID=UPI0011A45BD3|nr:MaoC/PaaZ C-terminal domain-containing protein [Bordetella genomosp. 13]
MTLDYQTVKSWHFDDVVQRYDAKDTMLYALGIGLGYDPMDERQLRYVYEDRLQAFPTMSVVLGYPGFWMRDPRVGIDWVRLVHGEQRLAMHAPLPPSGTVVGKTRVTHVVDKGADRGAIVVSERTLHDERGKLLATLQQSTFCRGDGGFGQGDAPPEALPATPEGKPDRSCTLQVAPNAALLYRLNADPNPLHVDPQVACKAGFPRPILHGLCTYGVAAHAIVRAWCDYDANRLTGLNARFSSPVFPGETLQCDMWDSGGRIQYLVRAVERNIVVISHGIATVSA